MATLHALSPASSPRPRGAAHWARRWEAARAASPWQRSQATSPQSWRAFYEQVASWWQPLSGHGAEFGQAAASCLAAEGLLWPGASALDVGCGAGSLSLALSEGGARVTALDDSPAMLTRLKASALAQAAPAPSCACADWQEHHALEPYDLVAAAFFPQALSPHGVLRLEAWSAGACALILGSGPDVFPFRSEIIGRLLTPSALGSGGPGHLELASGYLAALGREPRLRPLAWPVSLDLPSEEVTAYFRAYLAIFGLSGPRVERVVAEALEPHTSAGRVRAKGMGRASLLWWPVDDQASLARAAAS
ncbi:MAG: methyltransferase domain-containing protein [Desulfarculaceae bacterium]|nr:methyltransferase domain-containing protein [Desulfarculaceae bacterium]